MKRFCFMRKFEVVDDVLSSTIFMEKDIFAMQELCEFFNFFFVEYFAYCEYCAYRERNNAIKAVLNEIMESGKIWTKTWRSSVVVLMLNTIRPMSYSDIEWTKASHIPYRRSQYSGESNDLRLNVWITK